ncbi:hypothetical protein ABZ896_37755 [Streptomyces sp. NPDC047072]|uniref:hypothetical protein n=1 Tax=Streptomyces sp. NPDC047072 TaxID=3154809 RepID=UPI00340B2BE3
MADGFVAPSDPEEPFDARSMALELTRADQDRANASRERDISDLAAEFTATDFDLVADREAVRRRTDDPSEDRANPRDRNRVAELADEYRRSPSSIVRAMGKALNAFDATRQWIRKLRGSNSPNGPAAGGGEQTRQDRNQANNGERIQDQGQRRSRNVLQRKSQGRAEPEPDPRQQEQRAYAEKEERVGRLMERISRLSDNDHKAFEDAVLKRVESDKVLRQAVDDGYMPLTAQFELNARLRQAGHQREAGEPTLTPELLKQAEKRWNRGPQPGPTNTGTGLSGETAALGYDPKAVSYGMVFAPVTSTEQRYMGQGASTDGLADPRHNSGTFNPTHGLIQRDADEISTISDSSSTFDRVQGDRSVSPFQHLIAKHAYVQGSEYGRHESASSPSRAATPVPYEQSNGASRQGSTARRK